MDEKHMPTNYTPPLKKIIPYIYMDSMRANVSILHVDIETRKRRLLLILVWHVACQQDPGFILVGIDIYKIFPLSLMLRWGDLRFFFYRLIIVN